jgi:Tfp pilus assembly protein PilO
MDRAIVAGGAVFALLAALYFLMLAPKREEAGKLDEELAALQQQIDEQEQVAAFAEEARQGFPEQYGKLVVLGKAVPEQADSASMLVQLSSIASRSNVVFRGVTLAEGGGAPPAAPPPPPPAEGEGGEAAPEASSQPTATEVPAPATEAVAANLPIGSTVGAAGLPVLPYAMKFSGGFFDVGRFIGGVDNLIGTQNDGEVAVDGRLMTIDGFALKGGGAAPNAPLQTVLAVTTYVTPSDQGLTLGASPTAPAPLSPGQPQTTPASAVSP